MRVIHAVGVTAAIGLLVCILTLGGMVAAQETPPNPRPPNIVFISVGR